MNLALRLAQLRLASLEREVASAPVAEPPPYALTAAPWEGDGAFVTDDAFALTSSPPAVQGDIGVLTRHARPLSSLLFTLRDAGAAGALGDAPVGIARLADAANGFLASHQPEEEDWRPLLLAVLREARRALAESARPSPGRSNTPAPAVPSRLAIAA